MEKQAQQLKEVGGAWLLAARLPAVGSKRAACLSARPWLRTTPGRAGRERSHRTPHTNTTNNAIPRAPCESA